MEYNPVNKKLVIKYSLFLTAAIEAITMFFRFGLGLQSTRDTASTIGRLTFGIRIHHGFIGVLMLLIAFLVNFPKKNFKDILIIVGASLLLSDVLHHILLYIINGNADLDMFYPEEIP